MIILPFLLLTFFVEKLRECLTKRHKEQQLLQYDFATLSSLRCTPEATKFTDSGLQLHPIFIDLMLKKRPIGRYVPVRDSRHQREGGNFPCEAFLNFKKHLNELRANYKTLNPKTEPLTGEGCMRGPDDNGLHSAVKEFLRGGVISTLVAWEAFIANVMMEAFDVVVSKLRANPEARAILLELTDGVPEKGKQKHQWLLLDELDADEKVNEHKENRLRTIYPLLSQANKEILQKGGCVDKTFIELFYDPKRRAHFLTEDMFKLSTYISGNDFKYWYKLSNGTIVTLQIKNPILLQHILCLYYGLRNAFSHGRVQRTLHTGALSHFPRQVEELQLLTSHSVFKTMREGHTGAGTLSKDSARMLSGELHMIYEGICNDGRNVNIDFLTLLNLNRFFLRLAHFLPLVIAHIVHRDFKVVLWNYDPHKFDKHIKL
jgi:hypothetical protein